MVGFWYSLGAYLIWGCFPLFFSLLRDVNSEVVLAFRIIFGFVFAFCLMFLHGQGKKLYRSLLDRSLLGWGMVASILISINWFVFIWAVAHHRVLETSLGYFMTPLISLLVGRIFLKEPLNTLQWIAGGIAALAICFEFISLGGLPWVSLILAISFGMYGLVRKKQPIDSLHGLTLETLLVMPFALLFLIFFHSETIVHWYNGETPLLVLSGVLTAIPLLLFAASVRRINLVIAGFLMYVNPLMQFVCAVWILGETMPQQRFVTFGLAWLAMFFFIFGLIRQARASLRGSPRPETV